METMIRGSAAAFEVVGEGRPIVLLHGKPTDHRQMTLFFEPLFEGRAGWRRIYPDLPGMGRTPGPDWITDHDGMVDWTIAFLDAVVGAGHPIVLVGSSYGGYLALRVLERQPDRLDGLLLHAPAILMSPRRRLPPRRVIRPADAAVLAEVADDEQGWLAMSVVQTHETLEGFRHGTKLGVQAADEAFVDRLDTDDDPRFDARPPAQPFDRPTLILAGRQDHAVGYADVLGLMESFPRATVAVLDRAGHGVANEQRGLFQALAGEWLDRVDESLDG